MTMRLRDQKDLRVETRTTGFNHSFLQQLVNLIMNGLPMFKRDPELPDMNRVFINEHHLMFNNICMTNIKLSLGTFVVIQNQESHILFSGFLEEA